MRDVLLELPPVKELLVEMNPEDVDPLGDALPKVVPREELLPTVELVDDDGANVEPIPILVEMTLARDELSEKVMLENELLKDVPPDALVPTIELDEGDTLDNMLFELDRLLAAVTRLDMDE